MKTYYYFTFVFFLLSNTAIQKEILINPASDEITHKTVITQSEEKTALAGTYIISYPIFQKIYKGEHGTDYIHRKKESGKMNKGAEPAFIKLNPALCRKYGISEKLNGTFPTITDAVLSANINGISEEVRFMLQDDNYSGYETFPIIINNVPGTAPEQSLIIKPMPGKYPVIQGNSYESCIINVFDTKHIIIDGSNTPEWNSIDLTIKNTSTSNCRVISISSTGVSPVSNVTLKNCTIINGAQTSSAIVISDYNLTQGYFNNITIENNTIKKAYIGITAIGVQATDNGKFTNIKGNYLWSTGPDAIKYCGIKLEGVDGFSISKNIISNLEAASSEHDRGIWISDGTINGSITDNTISNINYTGTGPASPAGIYINNWKDSSNIKINKNRIMTMNSSGSGEISGIYIDNITAGVKIYGNRIRNIKQTNAGGASAQGIALASTKTNANTYIYNNLIYDIASYGKNSYTTGNGYGINLKSGGGYFLYYNSISMAAEQTLSSGKPACLLILSDIITLNCLDIRNNIFSISSGTGTNRYSVLCNATEDVFAKCDYNNYYSTGPNLGWLNGVNRANLASWKTGTQKDTNSISGIPGYIDPAADLFIDPLSQNAWNTKGMGTPIDTNFAEDFDGNPRNTSIAEGVTDLGAYNVITDPSNAPPPASSSGNPLPNTTTTYSIAGRTIASISWGPGGTVPTEMQLQFYSGTNPPNPGAFRAGNGYWSFTPTGGAGYTYNITLIYSESMLGNILYEANARAAKTDDSGATYTPYLTPGTSHENYQLDTVANTITIYGLTSFSIFALTDAEYPLPLVFESFTYTRNSKDINLKWVVIDDTKIRCYFIERINDKNGNISNAGRVNAKQFNGRTEYTFTDRTPEVGRYRYRIKYQEINGMYNCFEGKDIIETALPMKFGLMQNYPNPFNSQTKIDYELPYAGVIKIKVYDASGREAGILINDIQKEAGYHNIIFDGHSLSSGIYFYRAIFITNGKEYRETKKFIIVK